MAKVQSKKSQKTRKGQRGKKTPASKKSGGLSYIQIGLAVVAILVALAGAYLMSKRAAMQSSPPPAEDLDVWEWGPDKVAQYVRKQGKHYKRFAAIIESKQIGGDKVLDFTSEDLKELGFQKSQNRNKVLKVVNALRLMSGTEGVMTLDEARRRDPHHTLSGQENPDNTNFGATDKPSFCRLNRWLKVHGADLKKVYLDPEQRILRVRRKINKGETILTLPPILFMSTKLARTDSQLVQHLEKEMELGTHSLISIYMLEQMKSKKNTFWQPYIDVIPEDFQDIPIFWSDNEVKELQGDALKRYNRRRDTLKNDYDTICEKCPAFKDMANLEEFMWARTAVITRTFGLKVNGQKITSNLPIDFVMHANQPDTTWGYDQAKGCYHITAVREIPKDKFLTITYGKKANARFLVNYGFCLPVNSRNKGHISFDDPATYGESVEQLMDPVEIGVSVAGVEDVIKRCRTIIQGFCKRKNITDGWVLRRMAWQYLYDKCKAVLDKFPTTLEHDIGQLKRDDINQNVRNALYARSGEKTVVDFYLRMSGGALKKLREMEQAVADAEKNGEMPDEVKRTRNEFARKMFAYPKQFTEENLIVDPEL